MLRSCSHHEAEQLSEDCQKIATSFRSARLRLASSRRTCSAPIGNFRKGLLGQPYPKTRQVGLVARHNEANSAISDRALFSCFHILPQNSVDCGLIAAAVLAEKRQHIRINPQGYLLLRSRPYYGSCEEIRSEFRHFRKINVRTAKCVHPLPICPRSLFRIARFHDGLPSSVRLCE